jgi:hypothetical protein
MAEASFPPDHHGGETEERAPGWRGRRVLAGALVVLVAVSGLLIRASAQRPPDRKPVAPPDGRRQAPRVLSPVEAKVAFTRVQARGYVVAPGRGTSRTGAEEKGARKDRTRKASPPDDLAPAPHGRPAERVLPVRMAIIAASFPYRAQVEEFRTKLALRSDAEVLDERGADGLPTFRFLGVRVERRELGRDGKPLTLWVPLDVAAAYRPYLLLSGQRFEPEEPPALERLIFPGLVMPKLPTFRPRQYPPVEMELKTLRQALAEAAKPAPAAVEGEEVPPGIAKPRPAPVPPGVAKPRKSASPKAPPPGELPRHPRPRPPSPSPACCG